MASRNISTDVAFAAIQYGKEKEYWLEKLSGDFTKSSFPTDFKKTTKGEERSGLYEFTFSGDLFARLMATGTNQDHRLYMILVAALSALLDKYTGIRDVIIGTPIYKQETEGEFLNTVLALRNQIRADMTFKELLLQVKQTVIEAAKHQNYPIETLLFQLNIPASEDEFPLFDIVILLENIHEKKYIRHINHSMMFSFLRKERHIAGRVEYNSSLFLKATIERIVMHLEYLLAQALLDINTRVSDLDIVPEEERKQLLLDFNDTGMPFPADRTLHGLFEDQVELTTDHIAVVFENSRVTYGEINKKANQLAYHLKDKGVRHSNIVGIKIGRSIDMVIGILGILKSGSAYLPVDNDLPRNRILTMLEDVNSKFLITNRKIDAQLEKVHLFRFDQLIKENAHPVENPEYTPDRVNLAYVIFTSGSTGRPKAVATEHRNVVNTLLCRKENYKMDTTHVSLQLFSSSFDGFLTSFFTPIISGSRIILPGEEDVKNITRLKEIILKEKVSHFISIPILYLGIIENLEPAETASLKVITLAGDSVTPNVIELTKEKNENIEIVNEYGVTEGAVMSTIYRHQEKEKVMKIGKPIWNTRLYILNKEKKLPGIGVYGELCIGGAGVAKGYLNNQELTLEKFIENPFLKGDRLYRTGDLARWLPDRNIEFSGRIDQQVKIRGNRIELGEIESKLLNHKEIREAVVLVKEESEGKFLCAYYISSKEFTVAELREYLSADLPDYMIPAYFVRLEELPFTHSGKIDRKALPDPRDKIHLGKTYVPPTNEIEEEILNTWAEVLGLDKEKIGIYDNFFELGGNSISILKVQSQLTGKFDREISMSSMFLHPTIHEMAADIEKDSQSTKYESIVKLNNSSSKKNIFIIHPMHGMIYQYQELARLLKDQYNVYGVQARGMTRHSTLPDSLEMMAADYARQIRGVQEEGPYIIAGFCFGNMVGYSLVRFLEDMNCKVEKFIMLDQGAFIPNLVLWYYRQKDYVQFVSKPFKKLLAFLRKEEYKSPAAVKYEKLLRDFEKGEQENKDRKKLSSDESKYSRVKAQVNINKIDKKYFSTSPYKRITGVIHAPILDIDAIESKFKVKYRDMRKLTYGKFMIKKTSGGHDSMLEKPHVEKLARTIKDNL